MSFKIPLSDSNFNATYEFGLFPEKFGWTMEVSLNDEFFFLLEKDKYGSFVVDFAFDVKDRFKNQIQLEILMEILDCAKTKYLNHDVSHFDNLL